MMDCTLFIEPTKISPMVSYSAESNTLELKGRSSPENPVQFYKTIYGFLEKDIVINSPEITISIFLDYFNTSSSKCLYEMFVKVGEIYKKNKKININWSYYEDDDDMLKAGEDFESLTGLKFNYIPV